MHPRAAHGRTIDERASERATNNALRANLRWSKQKCLRSSPPPSAQIGLERQKPGHPETIQGLFAICYLQCPYSDALSTEPAWDLVASALSLGARGRVSHRGVKTARAWR